MLLREHTPPVLLAATLLAIVTAPAFFLQLQTNFADIPLAMLHRARRGALACVAAERRRGAAAGGRAVPRRGALTKNEGELFALAAFVAALVVARAPQRRPLAWRGARDVRDRAAVADLGPARTA